MVSGAAWLLDFVAFWNFSACLHLVMVIQALQNIAIGWPKVAILIEPLQVLVFLSLFFAHVRYPSDSELEQTGSIRQSYQAVRPAGFAVAPTVADVELADYHR